jgi:hypothetical protein
MTTGSIPPRHGTDGRTVRGARSGSNPTFVGVPVNDRKHTCSMKTLITAKWVEILAPNPKWKFASVAKVQATVTPDDPRWSPTFAASAQDAGRTTPIGPEASTGIAQLRGCIVALANGRPGLTTASERPGPFRKPRGGSAPNTGRS